ncbi:MAG: hypothetical protein KF868_21260 [Acidobacteria bacterium]|nr:hypothetical protein [Acidobacteriota bacterium]
MTPNNTKGALVKKGFLYCAGTFAVLTIMSGIAAAQVRVLPGDIRDNRSTGSFFNRLEVELRLVGDVVADAKGVRVVVAKAVDETGRDLMPERERENEFKEISSYERENLKVNIELKNPSRRAETVQEIAGTVELYVPRRDPAATVLVPNIARSVGRQAASPGLKAAGIEITIWNKEQYTARRKEEEEKMKKAFEERKKQAEKEGEPLEDLGSALAEGLMKAFGGLFEAFSQMEENGLALNVKDPKGKLVSIEFEDAAGKAIEHQGRSSMGSNDDKTFIYDFKEPLPTGARIKVYVMTQRAVVKSPFKLASVPLP